MPSHDAIAHIQVVADAVVWTLTSLATVCVALRLYSRIIMRKNAGLEDGIVTFAALFNITASVLVAVAVAHGTGTHIDDIPGPQTRTALEYNRLATAMTTIDIMIPKIAVALLVVRILEPGRPAAILLVATTILTLAIALVTVALTYTQSRVLIPFAIFGAAAAAAVDVALAVYPAIGLARLQISAPKKVGVSIVMGLGIISGAMAIYRATLIARVSLRHDPTYASAQVILWSSVEANACIMAACAPVLTTFRGSLEGIWTAFGKKLGIGSCMCGRKASTPPSPPPQPLTRVQPRNPRAETSSDLIEPHSSDLKWLARPDSAV